MTFYLDVVFLYAFLNIISCLPLWQNTFGNKLKGASFFATKYALSNFSFNCKVFLIRVSNILDCALFLQILFFFSMISWL